MRRAGWMIGLIAALTIAGALSPLASRAPDGLDHVAEQLGFRSHARREPLLRAPMADYHVVSIRDERMSTSVAGLLGTLLVFGAAAGLGALLRRKRSP